MRGLLIRARTLVFIGNCTASIVVASIVLLLGDRVAEPVRWTFFVICVTMPFAGQRVVQTVTLLALRRFVWSQTMSALIPPVIAAAAILGFYFWRGEGIEAYQAAGIHSVTVVLLLGAGAWLVRKAAPPETWRAKPVYRTREWLRASLPLVLVAGMQQLLNRVSIILIGILAGTTSAGIFMIASGLAQFTSFGLVATNTVASPLFSELYTKGSKTEMQRVVTLASWASSITALGIGALLLVVGGPLLNLFGSEFAGGGTVLTIFVVSLIVDAWTGPNGAWLNMTGHQDRYGVILGVSAVANLVFSVPAIHYWGIEGAAVVTFFATMFKNTWVWFEVKRSLGLNASIFGALPWR
jgi:O-antigen/teichoic acid export membrane protein